MDLQDYPRPRNDNGRGIHWFPTLGQRRAIVDQNVARLVDLKLRWLVLWNGLDDAALLVNDHLIKKLVAAGIAPVMHVYVRPISPLDDAALTRLHRLVAFYRDPVRRVDYFQLFYEPNVAGEWAQGKMPADPVKAFLDAWLPAAREVVNAGGLPGLAPLWQGGDVDDLKFLSETLAAIQDQGHGALLEKTWVAMHNYNLGEPAAGNLDLPAAARGSAAPAASADGYARYAQVDQAVSAALGRSLPVLVTEGGTRAGDPPYGDGAAQSQVAEDTAAAFERLKTAPDSYFCYCPWLFGNQLGGGDDPAWEPMAWFRGDGSRQPVVDAVRQLDDFSRPPWASPQAASPAANEKYIDETKHWVRGAFLDFFTRYGLDLCGYPLGEAAVENGLPTQYFQKLVMEEYWPGRIRLRPVGEEVVDLHVQLVQLQQQGSSESGAQVASMPTPAGESYAAASAAVDAGETQRLREERDALIRQLASLQAGSASGELATVAAEQIYKLQARVAEQEKALAASREACAAGDTDLRREAAVTAAERDRLAARLQDLQGRIVNGEVYEIVSREAIEVAELVQELEAKLAAADARIAQLEKERGQLEKERGQLTRKLKPLEKQVAAFQEQMAAAQAQAVTPAADLQELQDRITALEAQLTTALDQVKQGEAEKAQLAGQNAELQATLSQAQAVPPPDPVEIHALKDRIAQLEAALADSQAAVQAMMVDKPLISQVMDKWKSAQQVAGTAADPARVQVLQERIGKLEQELKDAHSAARSPQARGAAPAALAAAAAQSEQVKVRELRARVTELDSFVGAAQEEIRRLKEQNKQLSGHITELEAKQPPWYDAR